MAGVKGRSGRKSMRDEERRLRIIEKAWLIVGEILNTRHGDKYRVATELVLKDLAKSGNTQAVNVINQIYADTRNTGKEKEVEERLVARLEKLP